MCGDRKCARGGAETLNKQMKAKCVCMRSKELIARASNFGETALSDSRRLHSTLVAAPVLFAQAAVTIAENKYGWFCHPCLTSSFAPLIASTSKRESKSPQQYIE